MRRYYTLVASDVDMPAILAFGRRWICANFIGRILPSDVGKRVYLVRHRGGGYGFLQIENDEQRDARLAGKDS